MNLFRKILFPFSLLYGELVAARNIFYNKGILKSTSFDIPIINVGNLSVGGTGKTPMIEYLIKLFYKEYKVATLSRGYKRKTTGFQLANKHSTVETLGDEPYQFFNKFKDAILVAVDANRNNGIEQLRLVDNPPEIILLDDAFQHRKVNAGFNILLTTYNNLYSSDYVLPTGNLREPKSGASRANIIVVTKCPEILTKEEMANIIGELNPQNNQEVFFSSISYDKNVFSKNDDKLLKNLEPFTLVTGVANPVPMVEYLNSNKLNFEHLKFKDHHEFSSKEIDELNTKQLIVTTEKDFMRLNQYESLADKLYYLPIKVSIFNSDKFNKMLLSYVSIKR